MLLFKLLQFTVGNEPDIPINLSESQWRELYLLAKHQTLLGVVFCALEKLPKTSCPPRELLFKWMAETERIKERNLLINESISEIQSKFEIEGFRSVILKGQGNASLYDNPLSRAPGDIDVWVDGKRKKIYRYVTTLGGDLKICYHHLHFPSINGVKIEIHTTPSWMYNYFTNRRLQAYFTKESMTQFNGIFPSLAFNRVYLLVHIYRHLFDEGIGLRQMMDYYFVLKRGFTEEEREETIGVIKSLKMYKFTGAVMYVLQEVFGLDKGHLILEPREREGKFLLYEIMLAGNFGQYDARIVKSRKETSFHVFYRKIKRNLRFLGSYPSEVLWAPIFKIWHFFWRINKRIQYGK